MKLKPIIAIDGYCASGKGTLSKKIAKYFSFYHLETGLLYRVFAHLLKTNQFSSSAEIVTSSIDIIEVMSGLQDELNSEELANAASIVAQDKLVREYFLDIQRKIAYSPPEEFKGVVLDGRDTGTVVCTDADVKIFLTASIEERAVRRVLDLKAGYSIDEVFMMIKERDERDKNRSIAPLKVDSGYIMLDNTDLSIHESFLRIKPYLEQAIKQYQ